MSGIVRSTKAAQISCFDSGLESPDAITNFTASASIDHFRVYAIRSTPALTTNPPDRMSTRTLARNDDL